MGIDFAGKMETAPYEDELKNIKKAIQEIQIVSEVTHFVHEDVPLSEPVSAYDLLYWDGENAAKANATDDTKIPCFGMAKESGDSGNPVNVLDTGKVTNAAGWSLTPGAELYVAITDGNFTESPSKNSGNVVQRIGRALDSDTIFFDPDETYVEQA